MSALMTDNHAALALLTAVASAIGGAMEANHLMLDGLHVATARKADGKVWIRGAVVFDGFTVHIPAGCGESILTPGSAHATPAKIVAAIQKRLAARATSVEHVPDLSNSREPG